MHCEATCRRRCRGARATTESLIKPHPLAPDPPPLQFDPQHKGTVWEISLHSLFFIIFVLPPDGVFLFRVSERACIRSIFVHINIVRCGFYVFFFPQRQKGPRRPPDTFVKGRRASLVAARHLTHLPTCPINLNKCSECKPTVFPCLCETIFTVSIKDLFTTQLIKVG